MFRILKQYKHTGYVKMNLDDFKNRLDVPKTYQMNDITKRVLCRLLKIAESSLTIGFNTRLVISFIW
jgi:plasmid replication initiation protein